MVSEQMVHSSVAVINIMKPLPGLKTTSKDVEGLERSKAFEY